jgi:hypothetical protein
MAFSADGNRFALSIEHGSLGRFAKTWDTTTWKLLHTFPAASPFAFRPGTHHLTATAFSRPQSVPEAEGQESFLNTWDITLARKMLTLYLEGKPMYCNR